MFFSVLTFLIGKNQREWQEGIGGIQIFRKNKPMH